MQFVFTDNQNDEMHIHIDTLFELTGETSEQRNINADRLIEDYFSAVGKIPQSSALERLGSYIMREDYENSAPDKMTTTEYPTESDDQRKRRDRKFFPNADLSYNQDDAIGTKRTVFQREDGSNYEVRTNVLGASVPNITQKSPY